MFDNTDLEITRLECGDRVARNTQAAILASLGGGPDGAWSTTNLMFVQVVSGLRPYRKRAPRRWTPRHPEILLETW